MVAAPRWLGGDPLAWQPLGAFALGWARARIGLGTDLGAGDPLRCQELLCRGCVHAPRPMAAPHAYYVFVLDPTAGTFVRAAAQWSDLVAPTTGELFLSACVDC